MNLSALERAIDYRFQQPGLLRQAVTHRSFSADNNERLEFLGDSILNMVVAMALYGRFATLKEGELSRLRASLVRQEALQLIAERIGVGEALRLGEGELRSGGHRRPSILADATEAIFGAVFLDGGFDAARRVIDRLYIDTLDGLDPAVSRKDPKTALQEYLQGRRMSLPRYELVHMRGEAHAQEFEVECVMGELDLRTRGVGGSRRAAEQAAAKAALDQIALL
ncbi:ribonuclease III [Uliginosibacterium sp. sgz301328]|uniref:ribonuclease III n=1 Tax=Uliginosibacterium sp. sgz301328 TaxID=3243764 RepID=UPI00359EEC03